jgi:DNA-directed RNA polymerase specialized sigma24 family protein
MARSRSNPPTVEALLADADWVQAIARRLVGDASLAQDVVQETWLAALNRGPRASGNLRGWLGAVARNATRKMRRTELRRGARELRAAREEAQASTYEVVERFSTQHVVASALLELPRPRSSWRARSSPLRAAPVPEPSTSQ